MSGGQGERRVVTIVFADLVGFTAFAEHRDPEQVTRTIDGCLSVLAEGVRAFGGTVDKVVGDALLAVFGAPVAHEDDAERAVRAALRLQELVRAEGAGLELPLRLRVGVNTGEVFVGALRADGSLTAMGDVVNTAQRLQAAAAPGQVLVGAATRDVVGDAIAWEPAGSVAARNRSEPVVAWVAQGELTPPGGRRTRQDTALVGRDHELALIAHAVDLAVRRRRAHVVCVHGDAGVGKSRLVDEAVAGAVARVGARAIRARCLPYGESDPWRVAALIAAQLVGVDPDDAPVEALVAAVAAATEELVAVRGPREGAATAELVAAVVRDGLGDGDGPGSGAEGVAVRDARLRAVADLVVAVSQHQPVVLAVAEMQWADPLVLDTLAGILAAARARPVVVLATARDHLEDLADRGWPPRDHAQVVVRLDPLDPVDAAAMLDELLDREVPAPVRAAVLDRAGGNPLFLHELAALVAEGRDPDGLPGTLRGIISARLDALAPPLRQMLDNAAVLGSVGTFEHLSVFGASLGQHATEEQLRTLGAFDLLETDGTAWSFRNDSVREVAYRTLTKETRAQRHAGVARAMEFLGRADHRPDLTAHHWATAAEMVHELGAPVAGVPGDVADRAVAWLIRAAGRALRADAGAEASRDAGRGLRLLGPEASPTRAELLELRGRAEVARHRPEAVLGDADRLAELADRLDDDRWRAAAACLAGEARIQLDDVAGTARAAAEAEARARSAGDGATLGWALRIAGFAALFQVRLDAARAKLAEAREIGAATGDRQGCAWATRHLAWVAFVEGRPDVAEVHLAEAEDLFTELDDAAGRRWVHGLLAWVWFLQGRVGEAEPLARTTLAASRTAGDDWSAGMMLVLLASVRLWRGDADVAVEFSGEAREVFGGLRDRFAELQATAVGARALLAAGRVTDADRLWDRACLLGERHGFHRSVELFRVGYASQAGHGAGTPDIGTPDVEAPDVEAPVVEAVDVPATADAVGLAEWHTARALLALQAGDIEAARRELTTALGRPGAGPYTAAIGALVHTALGALDAARDCVAIVAGAPAASHTDRLLADLAAAAIAARTQRSVALSDHLGAARQAIDATTDRLGQAVERIGEAVVLAAAGSPAAPIVQREAALRLAMLGIRADGWQRALSLVAGVPVGV